MRLASKWVTAFKCGLWNIAAVRIFRTGEVERGSAGELRLARCLRTGFRPVIFLRHPAPTASISGH
jgi:hypothetical protein